MPMDAPDLVASRKPEFLEPVEHGHRFFVAGDLVTFPDQVAELAFAGGFVVKAEFRRPDFAEDDAAHGSFDEFFVRIAIDGRPAEIGVGQAEPVVRFQRAVVVGKNDFIFRAEERQLVRVGGRRHARLGGEIITAQGDVLRGRDDRFAGGRAEDVIGGHHQQAAPPSGPSDRQGHVHGHLVAVEVGVVGGADQRVGCGWPRLR